MSKYIDAEKLAVLINDYLELPKLNIAYRAGIQKALNMINAYPTADVEPVVRCAECRFFNREDSTTDGMCRCEVDKLWQPGFYRPYRRFGDFCSYGEKMDGKEAEK